MSDTPAIEAVGLVQHYGATNFAAAQLEARLDQHQRACGRSAARGGQPEARPLRGCVPPLRLLLVVWGRI